MLRSSVGKRNEANEARFGAMVAPPRNFTGDGLRAEVFTTEV